MRSIDKGVRVAGLAGIAGIVFLTTTQGCGSGSSSSFGDSSNSNADDAAATVPSEGFGTAPGSDPQAEAGSPPTGGVVDAGPPVCGDGKLEGDEKCDDGNIADNDGCTALCTVEANYVCNVPGTACAELGTCGDGHLKADEHCDDGNPTSGDGCSATCEVEDGWACPIIGAACKAVRCGDGKVAGDEECDDGASNSGDGCSSTCTLESGYKCPTPGAACSKTTCGDGQKEGTEQCDDGNLRPYDGCSPTCNVEPTCPKQGGACTGTCGDGIIFPGEECDDGNSRDGDGCSAKCTVETALGYTCSAVADNLQDTINQPIIYRDFSRGDKPSPAPAGCTTQGCPNGHADMNPAKTGDDRGLLGALFSGQLDVDGEPTAVKDSVTTTKALLADWYRSTPASAANPFDATHKNYTYYKTLPLTGQKTNNVLNGTYVYNSTGFFPIDGLGFGNQYSSSDCGGDHNFHFTSEMRFWFLYDSAKTAPRFDFTGDDDVFVFINGLLAVDIGGIHVAESDHVTLDATTAGKLNMTSGHVYEFALFQAERNRCQSDYTATFSGFVNAKSVCKSTCGDGIKSKDEVCDDGKDKNSTTSPPGYGKCASDCLSRGPYCGDGTTQSPQEACDDGAYNGGYGKCKVDCSGPGPRCGDGVVDSIYGEVCDDGAGNDTNAVGSTAYGKCASDCRSRPRCGDGILQTGEQCDDGNVLSGDGCSSTCTISSGGGVK